MDGRRTGMRAVPAEPAESHPAVAVLRALPAGAVHERQPLAEDVDARETDILEDVAAALTFEERQPQQENDARAELERFLCELLRQLERRVGDDAVTTFRWRALHQ